MKPSLNKFKGDDGEMNNRVYAGFWIRLAASLIDAFILSIVVVIPFILLMLIGNSELVGILVKVFFIAGIVGEIFYYVMMPLSKYQGTLGKYFLGLKIVDANGNKISAGKSGLRYFGCILSGIMNIGYIMVAFTERKRGLHDFIANTYVIKAKANQVEATNSQSAI